MNHEHIIVIEQQLEFFYMQKIILQKAGTKCTTGTRCYVDQETFTRKHVWSLLVGPLVRLSKSETDSENLLQHPATNYHIMFSEKLKL